MAVTELEIRLSSLPVSIIQMLLSFSFCFDQDVCVANLTDSTEVADLKLALLSKLDEKIWLSDFHYIASFLHPTTKSLSVSRFLYS